MFTILEHLKNRYFSQKAQGMTEYALIVALVVAIGIAVLGGDSDSALKTAIDGVFTKISAALGGVEITK